jgi:hypothetical protein
VRISDWASRFHISVRRSEERPDNPPAAPSPGNPSSHVVYRVVDLFSTRDGSWEPSDKPGSIEPWAVERYLRPWDAPDRFDDAGGDHHLFARVLDLDGKPITQPDFILYWSDGLQMLANPNHQQFVKVTPKSGSGWANQVVFNHFSPERGESGAWCWCPRGAADVVIGGGLPNNLHVSFFAVWQAEVRRQPSPHTGQPASPGTLSQADQEAIRRQAWQVRNLAYDPTSAFGQYARSHSLGAPLTGEVAMGNYIAQGFASGIVYAANGRLQEISHISW